ncbi:VWA domain-containing protein [Miltoncostaea marina]|uniref:VWA domain-containing protein n=1 Tax=Miltoncostaea marina TaxID=2843215 RepID=UPI001C3C65FC|nr:VWA domain-containing protein [Miltoncostaea marina]
MTFGQPLLLLLLLAVPLVAAAAAWWTRRRPAPGVPFPDLDVVAAADPGPRRRRHLPAALALLALAGFTFALARPELPRDEPRERATIMLAIDVSGSMAAADVEPFRLRAAQDAAKRFAEEVPRRYQVGLVSFSGQADTLVAPTTDRGALLRAIDGLVPDGATAVGEAIASSLEAIRSTQPAADADGRLEAARIVVLSDGATTVGLPPQLAAEDARSAGVPVFTVSLGTPDGILANGTPVPPDDEGLQAIAEITGGQAYRSEDAESVSAVYEHLGSFIGTERVRSEVTGWAAGAAALLLVAAGVAAWRLAPRLS